MIFLKLLFLYLKASKARKHPTLKPDGWKKVFLNQLPETGNKELKFAQIKDVDKFDLKLNENPFENLSLQKDITSNDKKEDKPFKMIFLLLEFWSRFDENLYSELILRLSICGDEFDWHMRSIEKKLIYKALDQLYIRNKIESNESCLSDFKFSIVNALKTEFKIDEFNILYLGVYYSTVNIDLDFLIDSKEVDKVWYKILENYKLIENPKSKGINPPIKYECKSEDCRSFLINSKKVKNRMFYPRTNSDWESFYESRKNGELFRLLLNEDLNFVADYTIEFFYYITKDVRLDIFTSLNKNSIVSLYSTYSYQLEDEIFKWLPVIINLKDLLPYEMNSVKAGFSILIKTTIQPQEINNSLEKDDIEKIYDQLELRSNDFELAAITNIRLKSGDYQKQKLNDFLTSWSSNGKKASNEWTCLVDSTEFYGGYKDDNFNNVSIAFFSPKFVSRSTYILISKWFKSNDQVLEIKIGNELKTQLKIDTFDENLKILNSKDFKLEQIDDNMIYYEVLNSQKHQEYYKTVDYKEERRKKIDYNYNSNKQQLVRLKLSFDLNNLNDDDKPRKVIIKDLNMGDPCSIPEICKFSIDCFSLSSSDYKCICQDGYYGKRCEYRNLCINEPVDDVSCKKFHNSTCISIADSYRCNCSDGYYWLNDLKKCDRLPYCYTNKDLVSDQCFIDYHLGYDINVNKTFKCNKIFDITSYVFECDEFDICKSYSCSDDKKCVASLQPNVEKNASKFCACDLDKGYFRLNNTCWHVSASDYPIPFFKQYLNCSHTYLLSKNDFLFEENNLTDFKMSCDCQNGYDLNGTDCILNKTQCTKQCGQNELCAFSDAGHEICVCQVGYYGANCTIDFCKDKANHHLITAFCGEFGCSSTDGIDKPKFVCNCDNRFYYIDNRTGLCKMKNVCSEEKMHRCKSYKATCMPTLNFTSGSLIADCVCAQGYIKNPLTKQCQEMCETFGSNGSINKKCFTHLDLKKTEFRCKPGFSKQKNMCLLSEKESKFEIDFEAKIDLNLDMYLKFNRMKNIRLDLTNLNCNEFLDIEGCVSLVNKSYLELEQRSNELLIGQSFIYSFSDLISISFQSIIGNDLFSLQVLDYELVENSSFIEPEGFYFKILKFKVYMETNGFFKNLDESTFLEDCDTKLCPIYPYLHVVRGSFRSKNLLLQETNYLSDCLPGSTPIYEEGSNSLYKCICEKGYKELAKLPMTYDRLHNKVICFDIDECSENVHRCDLNSTYCVNKLGGYECRCKNPLTRNKNELSCYELSELSPCDPRTMEYKVLDEPFECRCRNSSLLRMDDNFCWDPCIHVNCEIGECLPYRASYKSNLNHVCAYKTSDLASIQQVRTPAASMPTYLFIFLIIWTFINLLLTSLIILYKFGIFNRRK